MTYESTLEAVARAEDTYDFLQHIAWTDTIRPTLEKEVKKYSEMLVAEALGSPLPQGLTREKIAGFCYGVQRVSQILEKVAKDGEKALADLRQKGITL